MTLELWLPYVLASTIILIIPGPTIILVVSQAMAHGRRSVVPLVTGVLLGDFTAMTLSLLGLGALMSASAALFTIFKVIGAIYLFYLGIKMWRQDHEVTASQDVEIKASSRSLMRRSFIVTAFNPKSIAFFVAFLPQFIDPLKPAPLQLMILGGSFLLLATLNAALYAIFAGRLGEYMKKKTVRKWFNRGGGSVLMGAGIFTAAMERST